MQGSEEGLTQAEVVEFAVKESFDGRCVRARRSAAAMVFCEKARKMHNATLHRQSFVLSTNNSSQTFPPWSIIYFG